jgi:phosphatidate cytidylyltransferase
LARGSANPLLLRIASAAVLGPLVLGAVWAGGRWVLAMVLLAAAVMGGEWAAMAARGRFGATAALIPMTSLAAAAALGLGAGPATAGLIAAVGALLVLVAAIVSGKGEPLWAAAGTFWIALGVSAFLVLATLPEKVHETVFWLLATVWADDIAAYAVGRAVGGPKLAPRLSPNKTWAGFVGGVAAAGLAGALCALASGASLAALAGVSLLLGVAGQLGDLAESWAKRHFGVKDSGRLIPGHGGLLDRVDGLLAASLLAGAATLAAGRSPLLW